jgi:hypothetical protein
MTPSPNDNYAQARKEAAELLGLDSAQPMCPADALRVDLATVLRRTIDAQTEIVFDGEPVDLKELMNAITRLTDLLPAKKLPQAQDDDPRKILFRELMEMRERGEMATELIDQARKAKGSVVEAEEGDRLRAENEQLRAEIAVLRGGGGNPAPAITPPLSDIVPPGERAECDRGPRPGPDDPRPPSTLVIDAEPVPEFVASVPVRTGPVRPAPSFDYGAAMQHVRPDGTISQSPLSGRGRWGPV